MGARTDGTDASAALRNRLPGLSISTSRTPAGRGAAQEPVSPTARLVKDVYIVVSFGFGAPLDLPVFRDGIQNQLARYRRFRSIQVMSKEGTLQWVVGTEVNVDSHIIFPTLDPAAVAADPDKAVEDYVASLSTLPMDHTRPAWEFHLLDIPTSEATFTAAARVHHSFGDGVSLITLFIAATRSAADPTRLPAMLPPPKRKGAIYALQRRPSPTAGFLAFLVWVCSYLVLAWHTVVDVWSFVATIVFIRDPPTLFMHASNSETRRTRFVHRSLSLDDIKFLKNVMNCTVNDVLVGVTSAALSQYYFRNSGDTRTSKLCVRSILIVNLRPTDSLQTYVNMIESGDSNDVKWGNRFGYIILPFHIAMHNDPLEYVRKTKRMVERKKRSLEVIFTNMVTEFTLKFFGAKAGAFIFNRMFKHVSIGFSNVSGPTEQVVFCGHPVKFIAPSVYGPPQGGKPLQKKNEENENNGVRSSNLSSGASKPENNKASKMQQRIQ
ncbi:O-acyltransferase WSD1 isoform X2 [Brachypodium distachyon]|uniref:O-acyltransferase WSD1 isoform X2 n=1 Tax=Brachypodium distachyon TaxID=15368 RepID=UPI000D0CF04B|nr:O-acyltransferase WSD1 isoform X2 [Brachypodium distachyon]|eukprot:XP_024316939.1 O-acyltransferase WSD1 isoform X2 [Brachypodium distachyon]